MNSAPAPAASTLLLTLRATTWCDVRAVLVTSVMHTMSARGLCLQSRSTQLATQLSALTSHCSEQTSSA